MCVSTFEFNFRKLSWIAFTFTDKALMMEQVYFRLVKEKKIIENQLTFVRRGKRKRDIVKKRQVSVKQLTCLCTR